MPVDSITSMSSAGNRRIMDAFTQGSATGRVPSRRYLDQLIQGELDAAANNAIRQKALAEQTRQFDIGQQNSNERFAIEQQNALDTAEANRAASQTSALTNLATTAGTQYLLSDSHAVANAGKGVVNAIKPGTFAPSATGVGTAGAATPLAPVTSSATGVETIPINTAGEATLVAAPTTAGATGGTAVGSVSSGMAATDVSAEAAANAMYVSEAGGVGATGAGTAAAVGEAGGATLGSVAGGAVAAAPYIAAWKIGMPYLRNIMQTGTRDAFGVEPDSSNTLAQMNRIAGSAQGVLAPAYKEITGEDMPDVVQALTNPAGYIFGNLLGCIIITACTDAHSPEVEIAREYRNSHMDNMELRGYYTIAEKIVPSMYRFPLFKRFVKRFLVNGIIDYCEYAIGRKTTLPRRWSAFVMKAFLGTCGYVGSRKPAFVRFNGETV